MEEQSVQPIPTQPMPQEVPPMDAPKKGPGGVLWLVVILAIALLGGAGYVLLAQLSKPLEREASTAPPSLVTQEDVTDAPTAAPTISASDSISDIERDLSGTAIESENTTEFDADLQSLE